MCADLVQFEDRQLLASIHPWILLDFFRLSWFGEFGLEGKASVPFYLLQKSLMELFSVALVLLTVDLLSD